MALNLDNLSAELFALIAEYLDARALGSLRLLNRVLAERAILGSFSQGIRIRRVHLTRKNLQDFVDAISGKTELGRFIENLTLTRIICDSSKLERVLKAGQINVQNLTDVSAPSVKIIELSDEELDQIEAALEEMAEQNEQMERDQELIGPLLCRVFSLIKSQAHCLKRLSLEVAMLEDPRKPPTLPRNAPKSARYRVLEAAAQTFSFAMSSLQDLPVHALDIYHARPESSQCSVPCDLLARTTLQPQNYLQSLSISVLDTLSATMVYPGGYKNPDMDRLTAAVLQDENFTGLSRFLRSCPALEELQISHYTILDRKTPLLKQTHELIPRQMHELAKNVHHPRLRNLSLSGLKVDCRDLIGYLTKHRATLETLELRDFKIKKDTGLLSDVMDCLQGFALTTISFDGVHSDGSLCLYPKEQASPHTTISGYFFGQSAIIRTGDDVRKPLEYWHRRGPMVHSIDNPQTRERQRLRRVEYGSW